MKSKVKNKSAAKQSELEILRRGKPRLRMTSSEVILSPSPVILSEAKNLRQIASSGLFAALAMTLFFIFPKAAYAASAGLTLGSNIKCDTLTVKTNNGFSLNSSSIDMDGSGGLVIESGATLSCAASEGINIAGTLNMSSTAVYQCASSTITFDATSGTHNIITGAKTLSGVVIGGSASTYNLSTNNLTTGSLTVSGSTFNLNALDIAVTGNLTVNGGILDASNVNADIDVDGNVVVSSGTLIAPAVTDTTSFLVGGNWEVSGTGTFTHSSGSVVLDTLGNNTITTSSSNADDFYQLYCYSGSSNWWLQDELTVLNLLYIVAGTLDTDSDGGGAGTTISNLIISGDLTRTGTFTARTSTVTFNGSGLQTLTGETFYNLTVNNTAASPDDNTDVDSSAAVTVTNTLNVNDGQFQPTTASSFKDITIGAAGILKPDASASITVSGNLSLTSGGAFTHNSGTVNLGTGSQTITGNFTTTNTFNNLTKDISAAAAATLTMAEGNTVQVDGLCTLNGGNAKILTLTGGLNDTAVANLKVNTGTGTIDLDYLDVYDIDSTGGLLMIATNSTKDAQTVNWDVTGAVGVNFIWDGSASTVWGTRANWDRGRIPLTGSNVTIPSASNAPVLDAARTMNNLTIQTGGELSLNGNGLTLAGTTFSVEGTGKLKLQGDEVIDFGAGGAAMDTDSGTFEYIGGGDATYTVDDWGVTDYYNLIINKAAENFLLGGTLTVAKNLTITAGTLDTDADGAGAGTTIYNLTAKGNANFSGTFTARTSTVTLFNDGVDEIKTLTTGGNAFNNLIINHTAATTNTVRVSGALDVNGTLTLSDGTLDLDTNNVAVNVAGDVTIASGASVTPDQTGPWTFDGTTQNYTDSNTTKQNLGIIQIGT